jgi:hypothetical protein
VDYKTLGPDILVKKTTGFGESADLKLQEYINLRFEPGLYYTKETCFPGFSAERDALREVNSTYIHSHCY